MGNNPSKGPPINKWQYVPRSAKRPTPPGRPDVVPPPTDEYLLAQQQPDVITVRWKPPENDGGTPITGYLVERRDMGATVWVRAHAALTREPEVALAGLEPGRRYQFRVSAENALGLSAPSEPSAPLAVSSGSIATVPHFMRELKDTAAIEHEKVTFMVHVLGTPTPHISWYKDACEVFSSRRIRVSTENERSSVTFYQVALSDEGEIKCTATNRAGHVVTKARLRIEAPPKVKLPKNYEEGLLFELDDVIRLKVTVTGRPTPIITWLHNGEELQNNSRCEIVTTERNTSLRLLDSRREDRGEYMVRAHNELGEDIGAVLVTVTDRPCPPSKPRIFGVSGRSVMLEWDAPKDDGGCKIGNYVVEYYRIGWNVWLKAATCRQHTVTLDDLIEGSEYKFRIKAENPYGMSDPGEESNEVFIPDPRRGLLTAPSKAPTNNDTIVASDEWLEERRRKRAAMLEGLRAPTPPPQPQAREEDEEEYDDEEMEDEEDEEEMEEEEPSRAGSELMLVLVPSADKIDQQKPDTKRAPLSRQQSLDAPPPMSLSAPELSALGTMRDMQQTPIQLQRNAVSSTELLHEKAMARLYQALAAEEAEAEKRRHEGMEAEDAMERQEQNKDLPRPKVTDTGQSDPQGFPEPEKPPLKPALKKTKRKIPEPKPDDDLLDTKKTKSEIFSRDDFNIDIRENNRPLSPSNGFLSNSKRPVSPISRPFTPDHVDNETYRPLSPYLRGPNLHKDYDDVDDFMEYTSRPTSPSVRSVSPFSKVMIMEKPPEGYDYEPSPPPPSPPPIKPKKIRKAKPPRAELLLDGKTSPIESKKENEVFKIPNLETVTIEEPPKTPEILEEPSKIEEVKVKKPKKGLLKTKKKKEKVKVENNVSPPVISEPVAEIPVQTSVLEPEPEVKAKIVQEPEPEVKAKPVGVLKKLKKTKTKEEPKPPEPVVIEEPKPPTPEVPAEVKPAKKEKGVLKLKRWKVSGEKKVKIVEPEPEAPAPAEVAEKPTGKEKKTKEKKSKEKKSKKEKTEKVEGEESEKPKAKKGFSILGVKLRRPTEMLRGEEEEDGPEAPSRRRKSQRQIAQVRLSTSSDKSEEEAEARAIVVDRYGELISDFSKNRQFLSRRRQYMDREELKAVVGDDEDPMEMSPSPVSGRSGSAPSPAALEAAAEEDNTAAQIKNPPEEEMPEDEEDWEEESSRMSELPPSPPRSATPSRMWLSTSQAESCTPQRPRSSASDHEAAGEATRNTMARLTNAAVLLVVLWLSITVDWHLGLAVAFIYVLRKLYLAAKAKFQQVTGWGGLKKKERSPSPPPPPAAVPAITCIPEPDVPATPPPSPQQLSESGGFGELDYIEEEDEEDLEEEEEEDDDYDYSEEHSSPYENE